MVIFSLKLIIYQYNEKAQYYKVNFTAAQPSFT